MCKPQWDDYPIDLFSEDVERSISQRLWDFTNEGWPTTPYHWIDCRIDEMLAKAIAEV